MGITELAVLRWIHIIAMVYWLGGEWGVFQTSRHVINRKLDMAERKRHMETAYRIDILARTGILLLFPLGWHMGHIWGVQPFGGIWIVAVWAFFAFWLGLCLAAFVYRETDRGLALTKLDERIRFVFIPVILLLSLTSLLGFGPFSTHEGQLWFSAKIFIFGLLLCIGLKLRFIMREWTELFRILATKNDPEVENRLESSLRTGRRLAYIYWIGIASVAFFGATKFI
jgi:hypothetical protein